MPSSEVRSYNSDKVLVIVGPRAAIGLADGTFVTIDRLGGDVVTSQSGADGEVARAISVDSRHSVTLTVQQTSEMNDYLSGMLAADAATGGGTMFPIMVQDLLGREMFVAPQAWIARPPSRAFGKEVQSREWVIHTGRPTVNIIGGNN